MLKHRSFILLVTFFVIACAYAFHAFYIQAKHNIIDDLNNRQAIHARQAAKGIEAFFCHWTGILSHLSREQGVIDADARGRKDLNVFLVAHKDDIRAVARLDARGKILFTVPFNRALVGKDMTDMPHVAAIIATKKPVISDVFTAAQGFDGVAIHVPVMKKGVFDGSIGILVRFDTVARRYLEDIRIGETGYAWVIDEKGTEVYCPVPGHTGKSVLENCGNFSEIITMAREMMKGRSGVTTYHYDRIRGETRETVKKHAVYLPAKVGDTFWTIVVATAENEILAPLGAYRNRLFIIFGAILVIVVLLSYVGMKAWGIVQEERKRKDAEEALRRSEGELRIRNEIATIFLTVHGDDIYRSILDVILRQLASPFGLFGYINRKGVLILGSLTGRDGGRCLIPGGGTVFHPAMWSGLWGRAMTERKPHFQNGGLQVPEGHISITRALCVPIVYGEDLLGIVTVANRETDYGEDDVALLASIVSTVSPILNARLERDWKEEERKETEVRLQKTLEDFRRAIGATVQVMIAAVERKDPYTAGHQKRTTSLAVAMAKDMGLPDDTVEAIRMAGSVHDIGKISVPAELLAKPTVLEGVELSIVQAHAQYGYDILKDVESPWPLADIVYQHHERMDGSGYPRGLKGDEIRIEARILAVADVVESMASHRPYRPSMGIDAALGEIERNAGTLYDTSAVHACLALFRQKGYILETDGLQSRR